MKKLFLLLLFALSFCVEGQVPLNAQRFKAGAVQKQNEPSPLYIGAVKTDEIVAQWQNLGTNVTFVYQHADDAAFSTSLVEGTTSSNTVTITGLSAGVTKYFRVRAVRTNYSTSDWVGGSAITMPSNIVAYYNGIGLGYNLDNGFADMSLDVIDLMKSIVNTSGPTLTKTAGTFSRQGATAQASATVQNIFTISAAGYVDASSYISLGTGAFTFMTDLYSSGPGGASILACDATAGGNRFFRFTGLTGCFVAINNVFSSEMIFPKAWKANEWTKIIIDCNGTTVRASCDGGQTWSNSVTRPGSGAAFNLNRIGANSAGANQFNADFKYIFFADKQLSATERERIINFPQQQNTFYNIGAIQTIAPSGFSSTLQPAPTNNYHTFPLGGQPQRGQGYGLGKAVYSFGDYSVICASKTYLYPSYGNSYLFGYNHATHRLTDPINMGRFGQPDDNHFKPSLALGNNTIWVEQMWRHYSIANGETFKITRVFGKNYDFSGLQTVPNGNELPGRDTVASGWMTKTQYHQTAFVGNTMLDFSQRWNGGSSFGQYIIGNKSIDGGNNWETTQVVNTGATFWVYPCLVYNGNQDEAYIIIEQVLAGSPTQSEGLVAIKTSDGVWYSNLAGTYKKNVVKDGAFTLTELYTNCNIIDARSLTSTAWGHGLCTTNGRIYGIIGNGSNTGWKLYYQDKNSAPVISGNISVSGHTLMTETQVNYLGTYTYPYHRSVATVLYKGGTTWWGVFLETNSGNWKPILCESTDDGVTWAYLRDVGIPENKQHVELEFSQNYHWNGDKGVLVMAVHDAADATRMVIIPTSELGGEGFIFILLLRFVRRKENEEDVYLKQAA